MEIKLIVDKPDNISTALKNEAIDLIASGGQIRYNYAKAGLQRAGLIALLVADDLIIATACFKNPNASYRDDIFDMAMVSDLNRSYSYELGYIVTRKGYEGHGSCQKLLKELFPLISGHAMFATTRKPEMVHILKKLGFQQQGGIYKEDLILLTYK